MHKSVNLYKLVIFELHINCAREACIHMLKLLVYLRSCKLYQLLWCSYPEQADHSTHKMFLVWQRCFIAWQSFTINIKISCMKLYGASLCPRQSLLLSRCFKIRLSFLSVSSLLTWCSAQGSFSIAPLLCLTLIYLGWHPAST